jgi:hypothetical protein
VGFNMMEQINALILTNLYLPCVLQLLSAQKGGKCWTINLIHVHILLLFVVIRQTICVQAFIFILHFFPTC